MVKGTVKFFNRTKRFGFIKSDEDGEEYFVHADAVTGPMLKDDDKVEFTPGQSDRGPRAEKVTHISADVAAAAPTGASLADMDDEPASKSKAQADEDEDDEDDDDSDDDDDDDSSDDEDDEKED